MSPLRKKKSPWNMGEYTPTKEELKAYAWCIRNNIIIAPLAKAEGCWLIEITINGKKNRSPEEFIRNVVWEKLYQYCKYYYDKYDKKI